MFLSPKNGANGKIRFAIKNNGSADITLNEDTLGPAKAIRESSKMTGGNLFFFQDGRVTEGDARPVLGGILSGKESVVGDSSLEGKLASAEAVLQRIERGIRRLEG